MKGEFNSGCRSIEESSGIECRAEATGANFTPLAQICFGHFWPFS